ncbi:Sulfate transporter [Mycena sanguinolenta]|uniref:Sulfate transporter n=1 Tax=Mycena sanguinolenta TaxID=230812 RepID=A0A8H6ZD73_9AGAR|nr:Sulfate transporter [Mycena sanguinolenta]
MDVVRTRSLRFVSSLPTRLYRALPAVILGFLFNILDAVSTGILLFPNDDRAFRSLQLQGLSMYIMSTLTSQLVMTLGGSRFPGAMGTMLIEIFPFLRGIATDIRGALGDDHPGLIPTVMAAYALTSILTGAAFVILGILKLGNLVAYFPQTVLTGAIGAIGVSLFVLGLELPFPSSSSPLSLSNAVSELLAKQHLGLLAATFFPCVIPFPHSETITSSSSGFVDSWNYWTLFDFSLVQWWSLQSAIQNLVLLVVIGVLNLPIYVPTLAFTLDVSYDMNYELFGQGAANILAGLVGTVPNIIQYSYSVYVTRAKGGRFELAIVSALTAILIVCSGLLLPYVPTILASALVLFLGIELFLEAIWEASKTLSWMEYAIVLATLAACTFLGFAEGFGVGIGAAAAVYLMYGVIDSPARVTRWNEWNELQQVKTEDQNHVATPLEGRLPSPHNHTPAPIALDSPPSNLMLNADLKTADADLLLELNARVLILSGYIFFASVPSLEKAVLAPPAPATFFILDYSRAHRIETAAARILLRLMRELGSQDRMLVVCGVRPNSGLHADFIRAEVPLVFDPAAGPLLAGIAAFETRAACLSWCRREHERRLLSANKPEGDFPFSAIVFKLTEGAELDQQTQEQAFTEFCRLFDFQLATVLVDLSSEDSPLTPVSRFIEAGGRIVVYLPGQVIPNKGIEFVIEGQIDLIAISSPTDTGVLRPSVQRLLAMMPQQTLRAIRARLPGTSGGGRAPVRSLKAGDVLDCRTQIDVAVAKTRSVVVKVDGEQLTAWAQAKRDRRTHAA